MDYAQIMVSPLLDCPSPFALTSLFDRRILISLKVYIASQEIDLN